MRKRIHVMRFRTHSPKGGYMSNFFRVIDLPLDCPTTVVGKMWLPEDVETSASPTFLEDSDFEEQIEDKVVKSGRGRRPQRPTEGVETK